MISLATPVDAVPRISKKIVPALRKLGIKNIRDLLLHFPSRYEDFSRRVDIKDATLNEVVTVQGIVRKIDAIRTARKRMVIVHALIEDASGKIRATWFNQPYLARILKPGERISLSGKVALGPNGKYLQNPAYEKVTSDRRQETGLHTGGLVAVYPETRGITSRWLRFLVKNFIELRKNLSDSLPFETRRKYQLPEVKDAVLAMHFPRSVAEAEKARKRFNFEEMLLIQLRALKNRVELQQHRAPAITLNLELIKSFVASLPFELTDAQRRSIWEIVQDLSKPRPMNRLLEGDVGSGKTVVAAAASLLAAKAGFKVAFMAPTEILARQHFDTLNRVLSPFKISIGLLVGAEKKAGPDTDIAVGTHALIQDRVKFQNLGLVIVDEQHRFGVEQRARLVKNNAGNLIPHFLSMSATPIPRTLALTVYGDLELSLLDEMPKSRKIIITKIVEPERRPEAYQFIRAEVKKGRQAFVICPRIEIPEAEPNISQQKSLVADVKAVKEEYQKLSEEIFPDLRVAMLHGKLKSKEKEAVMKKLKNRGTDILVSTSVVEVGVDIPNATIMMIEGAERFGLAQLHQFRGRVGRGAEQSYCFLFSTEDGLVSRRLRAVAESQNGFELAEKDLEIRGPGDLFGIRQWGVSPSVLAAFTDAKLVREVRQEAAQILNQSPTLEKFPELKKRLEEVEKIVHRE